MPKPTLSPSRITTYLACPVKYRWTYVDARGKWYSRSKSYYSFGASLHKVLERFHDEGDVGVSTTDEVMAALDESWIDAGFSSAEEMAEAYGEGKQILERYVSEAEKRPKGTKAVFVERQFRHDMGDFDLIGRIDRVDEHEDGSYEIIDYKSGREEVSPSDVEADIAMSVYQLLLKRQFPTRSVRATIVALRTGRSASFSLTDDDLNQLELDLRLLGQQILSDEFYEFLPKHKRMCSNCDFLPLCRRHEEFAEQLATAVPESAGQP